MRRYSFDWVDAFTSQPFGGNGCAVVHDAGDMSDADCMAFVRETSLVECTFLEPSATARHKVRYFVARGEMPFAGHPTIATVASLIDRGLITDDAVTLETGAGVIPIRVDHSRHPSFVEMTQIAPQFGAKLPAEIVAAAIGLSPDDILGTPQIVSTGLPFCVTILKNHNALRAACLDSGGMAGFHAATRTSDTQIMEPYLVALEGATERGATFARLLMEPPLPSEDPFTGSATGATAALLWHRGLIEGPAYVAEQGHWMGRPGQAQVTVQGPRDAITGVRVGGQGRVLMRGELML